MYGDATSIQIGQARIAAQELFQKDTQIEAERDDLMAFLRLREHSWDGDAREAYQMVEFKWQQAMAQMDANLKAAAAALDYTADSFDHAEKHNKGLFQV